MEFKHKSVLLDETIDSLNIKPDGIYVDGTLGGGGHSLEICKRLSDKGRLIGIDQDLDAIAAATERLKDYKDRVTIVHSNYQDIDAVFVILHHLRDGTHLSFDTAQSCDDLGLVFVITMHRKPPDTYPSAEHTPLYTL